MATHWCNWARLFFNNKGVAARWTLDVATATKTQAHYRDDTALWKLSSSIRSTAASATPAFTAGNSSKAATAPGRPVRIRGHPGAGRPRLRPSCWRSHGLPGQLGRLRVGCPQSLRRPAVDQTHRALGAYVLGLTGTYQPSNYTVSAERSPRRRREAPLPGRYRRVPAVRGIGSIPRRAPFRRLVLHPGGRRDVKPGTKVPTIDFPSQ